MNFYYFNRLLSIEQVVNLEDYYFDGILFTYNNQGGDFFTRIARNINLNQTIKYMVAIRPYAISPQYLCMFNQSINKIMPGRLQINLISGHIEDNEKNIGGIIGPINDSSSNIERSNYLISYMQALDEIKQNVSYYSVPDFYVSVSNEYVFNAVNKINSPMIIEYKYYMQGYWNNYINYQQDNQIIEKGKDFDLTNKNVMLSLCPILRKNKNEINNIDKLINLKNVEYFTYDEFTTFIQKLQNNNINNIMLTPANLEEKEYIINFVKEYKQKELARK